MTPVRLRALRYGETGLRALLLTIAILLPSAASADWLVMPQASIKFGTSTNLPDPEIATGEVKITYGAAVAWLGEGVVGFEADFGYTPGFFNTGGGCVRAPCPTLVNSSYVTTLVSNVMIAAPQRLTEYSLRPYVSGGGGWMRVQIEEASFPSAPILPLQSNLFAFNVGGGAMGFFSPRTGIRWDLRYFRTVSSPETISTIDGEQMHLGFWRASVAVVLR